MTLPCCCGFVHLSAQLLLPAIGHRIATVVQLAHEKHWPVVTQDIRIAALRMPQIGSV